MMIKKYNAIWSKISNIKKELDCKYIYNNFFLKTKINSYGNETTNIHTKIPEAASNYICWSVILIDNILKKDKNYYLQVFLIECKNIAKEQQVIRYITDDSGFPSDFDESDHDGVFKCAKRFLKQNKIRHSSLKQESRTQKSVRFLKLFFAVLCNTINYTLY